MSSRPRIDIGGERKTSVYSTGSTNRLGCSDSLVRVLRIGSALACLLSIERLGKLSGL